jgi:hypothetical protein
VVFIKELELAYIHMYIGKIQFKGKGRAQSVNNEKVGRK